MARLADRSHSFSAGASLSLNRATICGNPFASPCCGLLRKMRICPWTRGISILIAERTLRNEKWGRRNEKSGDKTGTEKHLLANQISGCLTGSERLRTNFPCNVTGQWLLLMHWRTRNQHLRPVFIWHLFHNPPYYIMVKLRQA